MKKLSSKELKLWKIIRLQQDKIINIEKESEDTADVLLEKLEHEMSEKEKLKKDNEILISDNKDVNIEEEITQLLKEDSNGK